MPQSQKLFAVSCCSIGFGIGEIIADTNTKLISSVSVDTQCQYQSQPIYFFTLN